jgi:tetratricopeptide (TPR) repeat protein
MSRRALPNAKPRRPPAPQGLPRAADHHYETGLAHLERRELAQAIGAFERALASNPAPERQAAILFALANAARMLGMSDTAENFYRRVLSLEPGRIEAIVNLSNLFRGLGRYREAERLLGEALEGNPQSHALWLSLGHIMRETGNVTNARLFFTEALRLKPDAANALASLADLLVDLGEVPEALALYDKALKKEPRHARARLHRALMLLSEGHLKKGWRDYAARFEAADPPIRYTHDLPQWTGAAIPEKRLLIAAEQGLGDQLIFASVIGEAMARAGAKRVIIECEQRLVPLFARSFPDAKAMALSVVQENGAQVMRYGWLADEGGADFAMAMGSLPALFVRETASEPAPFAYLRPDLKESRAFRAWLASLGDKPCVGICWRSGKLSGQRALQFAPRSAWGDFLASVDASLISLQYDATESELAELSAAAGRPIMIPPGLDQKNELDRLAALIAGLDAVVTAPTAVSALAPALGAPTLKVLFDRSWTSLGRAFEPLSPACRLVRPDKPGDWAQTFAHAGELLSAIVAA